MKYAPLLIVPCLAASALGQSYLMLASSRMTREVCPPPCPCPNATYVGPLYRTFMLAPMDVIPPYTRYTVTLTSWGAALGSQGPVYMTGSGVYTIGGEGEQLQRLEMTLNTRSYDSGLVPVDPAHPFPAIAIETISEVACVRERLRIVAGPLATTCYANCDESTASPVLNANDFQCFLNAFATGNMWADCDQSHTQMLTGNDFQCFLNAFAAGCS